MINKLQFEIDIIEKSEIPYVAAGGGIWINSQHETLYFVQMSIPELKECITTLEKTNCPEEFKKIEPVLTEKVTESNRAEFIEELEKLKKGKIFEIESIIKTR